jgi:hypothetical protein
VWLQELGKLKEDNPMASSGFQPKTNLPAICVLIVYECGFLDISQPYEPLRSATGIALLFVLFIYFYLNISLSQKSDCTKQQSTNKRLVQST